MSKTNQNNELFEISKINGNMPGLRKENEFNFISPYISRSGNNVFNLESYDASLNFNFPIFDFQEKGKINISTTDEKSPTEERELYLIQRINNFSISPLKLFTTLNKKRRGRPKQKGKQEEINKNEDKDYIKIHDKYRSDNVLRKIQVHYLTFIVLFLNEILAFLNFKQTFRKFSYKFKMNVKKEFVNSLKTKTIGDIICTQRSNKYKCDLNHNKKIYEETRGNKILKNLYSENYMTLFRKIYFKSEKIINLREYGLNTKIILSDDVRMFKDLIKNKDNVYKVNINNSAKHNFMINSLLFKTE